jgi:NAD(P)-dependent dehydrogenase (short-subunit alcohol dehydrogenase family)
MIESVRYSDLQGRVVLVTGGAAGIGQGIVAAFAAQGAQRLLPRPGPNRRRSDRCFLCSSQVLFRPCDLTDISSVQATIADVRQKLGPVTVLVNNAGNDDRHQTRDVSPAYFDERVAVNLRHMFFAAQSVLDGMVAAGGGSIINLGSIAWKMADGGAPIYVTCKAAVHGLTRALAREFGKQKIRVNTVLPGWVMTERQLALWVDAEAEADMDRAQCLPGRLQPEDIAAMVLFLASDQARMCTGQEFIVDAGWV